MPKKWNFLIFMYNERHGDYFFFPPDQLNSEIFKKIAPHTEMHFEKFEDFNRVGIVSVSKEDANTFLEKMMQSLFHEGWELYLVDKTTYFFRKQI